MFTESKGMTTLNQMLMSYLQIMTSRDSISTQWTVITFGDDDYIVGWYAKNKKVIGCVINLNLIFRTIRAKTEEYDVIPFMVDARGRVMTQADTSEKYKNEIIDFSKAGKKKKNATVYSYQLGTVGKINLMVLPGGGILENVLIMQIAFVVLIAVLLIVCALEITAYYHRILVPLEKFGQKLEDLEKEQSLNEDGNNNLLELESVSGKFKELLRKIQGLKIAIYEKETAQTDRRIHSSGVFEMSLGNGGESGKSYFSDEIMHGLGNGPVCVEIGNEYISRDNLIQGDRFKPDSYIQHRGTEHENESFLRESLRYCRCSAGCTARPARFP